ncbi:helix-turn-helix transcriptional regulator [Lichenicoccus sp.]|uniref:helix-turn-helix transcriptional regulator n=1 Tax=Lichenicoccus sp. TaxID=2781899 RepID=UPI003D0BC263
MATEALPIDDEPLLLGRFKLARIRSLDGLESDAYLPELQPYFRNPGFRRLREQFAGRSPRPETPGEVLATRGASGLDGLDVAYVANRFATVLTITEAGLPDYCILSVRRGALELRGVGAMSGPGGAAPLHLDAATGAIYRGRPGTQLRAADKHERQAVWIPAPCLERRLAALLGEPPGSALEFAPDLDWESGPGRAIRSLVSLLTEELADPHSFALNSIARQSFTDLLLYALLQALPHSYTTRLARGAAGSPVPRTVRRAEDFIRARAGQPVAMHEVAQAAGCSVRALQLGFRRFRDTTPAAAMRRARLEAARQALAQSDAEATVGDVARRYGFTNPGRFASLYKAAFGAFPAEAMRRR